MKRLLVAGTVLIASAGMAMAQSKPNANTSTGPAMEGGRTQATPGGSAADPSAAPANPIPNTAQRPSGHSGGAVEAGKNQATPGVGGGTDMNPTGSVNPRPSTPARPDAHSGGAIEGGKNQARP